MNSLPGLNWVSKRGKPGARFGDAAFEKRFLVYLKNYVKNEKTFEEYFEDLKYEIALKYTNDLGIKFPGGHYGHILSSLWLY